MRIYTLQTSMAAQVFLLSAPKELGGRGDFAADLEREAEAVDLHQDAMIKFAQQVSLSLGLAIGPTSEPADVLPFEIGLGAYGWQTNRRCWSSRDIRL